MRKQLQATGRTTLASTAEADELLDTALEAARAAAAVIRTAALTRESLVWEEKGVADFVTEVDRAAEASLAAVIRARCPDSCVLGEELSPEAALVDNATIFVADPLDGTTNFLHGYPQFAVSIGVLKEGQLVAGVVVNAASGETFTATRGGGTFRDGERVAVSNVSAPGRALIGTGFPFSRPALLDRYSHQFVEISRSTAGIRRAGSAALDLADVACGRFDGFWELVLSPWDMAAGILLVREAGGIITDASGLALEPCHGAVVAGNPGIHHWLLGVLAAVDNIGQQGT